MSEHIPKVGELFVVIDNKVDKATWGTQKYLTLGQVFKILEVEKVGVNHFSREPNYFLSIKGANHPALSYLAIGWSLIKDHIEFRDETK